MNKRLLLLLALSTAAPVAASEDPLAGLREVAARAEAASSAADLALAYALAAAPFEGRVSPGVAAPRAERAPARRRQAVRRPASAGGPKEWAPDGDKMGEGIGGMLIGAAWGALGLVALANPLAAVVWGALCLFCAAAYLFTDEKPEVKAGGAVLLGLVGALCVAAPPLGAMSLLAVGAAAAAIGLGLLIGGAVRRV